MLGTSRWLRFVGLVVVVALFLTSCTTASGGGWIPSAEGIEAGKATFGFNFKCKDTTGDGGETVPVVSGQLQYNDHPADVRFHGEVPNLPIPIVATCAELRELLDEIGVGRFLEFLFGHFEEEGDGATAFLGLARRQPSGEEGIFFVLAGDAGEPGENDAFCIGLVDEENEPLPLGFQPANILIITPGVTYVTCGELGGGNIQVRSVK